MFRIYSDISDIRFTILWLMGRSSDLGHVSGNIKSKRSDPFAQTAWNIEWRRMSMTIDHTPEVARIDKINIWTARCTGSKSRSNVKKTVWRPPRYYTVYRKIIGLVIMDLEEMYTLLYGLVYISRCIDLWETNCLQFVSSRSNFSLDIKYCSEF